MWNERVMDVQELRGRPGGFAATVRVGAKGRIVIPERARDLFDINPGDTLLLLADADRGIALMRQELLEALVGQALTISGVTTTGGSR